MGVAWDYGGIREANRVLPSVSGWDTPTRLLAIRRKRLLGLVVDAIPFGRRTGSLELAGRTFKGLLAEFDVADHTVDLSFTDHDSANSIQLLERPKLSFENLELL